MTTRRRIVWCIAGLGACGGTTPAPVPDPGPLPPLAFEFDVTGQSIAVLQSSGPPCDGEVTGSLALTSPDGRVERHDVRAPTHEERCFGCDPPADAPPDVCDNACTRQPVSRIELLRYGFGLPGHYLLSGAELTLTCAAGRTRFADGEVDVAAEDVVPSSPPDAVSVAPLPVPVDAAPSTAAIESDGAPAVVATPYDAGPPPRRRACGHGRCWFDRVGCVPIGWHTGVGGTGPCSSCTRSGECAGTR